MPAVGSRTALGYCPILPDHHGDVRVLPGCDHGGQRFLFRGHFLRPHEGVVQQPSGEALAAKKQKTRWPCRLSGSCVTALAAFIERPQAVFSNRRVGRIRAEVGGECQARSCATWRSMITSTDESRCSIEKPANTVTLASRRSSTNSLTKRDLVVLLGRHLPTSLIRWDRIL